LQEKMDALWEAELVGIQVEYALTGEELTPEVMDESTVRSLWQIVVIVVKFFIEYARLHLRLWHREPLPRSDGCL
jgi:hypothetical protein